MRVINNRYALQREIGRGSSGSVWLARDETLRRGVAIKVIDRALVDSPEAHPEVHHEARVVAQLRSPHIVQVYDLGEDQGQPYLVMELLEGESLDVRLVRQPRLPLRTVCRYVQELAKGLTQVHAAGIIHRDLKPANIFIARESGRELVKILDFGVSGLFGTSNAGEDEAGTWSMLGTPQYMAPEHFAGSCDHRADLWSLGVIAFQMLAGCCPFVGKNIAELRRNVREQDLQQPPTPLEPALAAFFARALAKAPGERFQSAAELSLALSQVAESSGPSVTRVLVVDDEADMELLMRQRFRKQLRAGEYELFFALNGEQGLAALAEHDIDVVLTDLNMPGMGGLAFITRALESNPLARVVVVSAYGDMANIRAAMNNGAFDFIEKPIDFADLQRTIEKCAQHVSVLREARESIEENRIMRLLVGQGAHDDVVREVKAHQGIVQTEREATVLFIDFYSSSAVTPGQAPEVTFNQLNAHFELLVPEVYAQEGWVVRLVGDALFCLFDGVGHLQRALAACDTIRDRLHWLDAARSGLEPRRDVCFGLDTGRVLSGGVGSPTLGRLEHATVGRPVGLAYRLYGAAERGELLVSDDVRRRIEGQYLCDPVRDRVLPAALGPVPFFRVLGKVEEAAESRQRRLGGISTATIPLPSNS